MIRVKSPVRRTTFGLVLLVASLCATMGIAQSAEVILRSPILITSAGQSADTAILSALLRRTQTDTTVINVATPEDLTEFSTLLITLGGSQKGLGAAGISVAQELSRIESLLEAAESADKTIVAIHIGGEGRRGPLSDPFIQAVAPRADIIIATNDGNKDGVFTSIAEESSVPLELLERVNDVGDAVASRTTGE